MDLKKYLTLNNISQESFGAKVGLTQCTINKISQKKQRPSWINAQKIIAASNGEVTMEDLMIPLDHPMTKINLPPPSHRECDCTEHMVVMCAGCGKQWKLTPMKDSTNE